MVGEMAARAAADQSTTGRTALARVSGSNVPGIRHNLPREEVCINRGWFNYPPEEALHSS
jgi:hypothetical protein